MKIRNYLAIPMLLLLICASISTAEAAVIIPQGGFNSAEWIVNPRIEPTWNPFDAGAVDLHPPESGFVGAVIYRNLNVDDIPGKTMHLNISLRAGNNYYTTGSSVAVYLTYVNGAGLQRTRILSPANSAIPTGSPADFAVDFQFPSDARKLVKIEVAKEDYGPFYAHEIGLATDEGAAVTIGPLPVVTSLSSPQGPYGSTLTIFGQNFGSISGDVKIGGSSDGISVGSWTESSVSVNVQDPVGRGPVKIITDYVESNIDHRYEVTSPYFTVRAIKPDIDLIKGQMAGYVLAVDFVNGFTSGDGIGFQLTGLPEGQTPFFTPVPVRSSGGTMLKIDTQSLSRGRYPLTVQATATGMQPRSAALTLNVETISDIIFDPPQSAITTQGYVSLPPMEAVDSAGNARSWMPGEAPLIRLESDNPAVFSVYPAFMEGFEGYALASGSAALVASTPDGYSETFPVSVDLTGQPQVTINLSPNLISNKPADLVTHGSEPIAYYAGVSAGEGFISYSDPWELSLLEDSRAFSGTYAYSGSFRVDLSEAPKVGTYLFGSSTYGAQSRFPFTIFNDPTYSGASGRVIGIDSEVFAEHFTLEFYDPATGALLFSKEVGESHGMGRFKADAVEPGTYKIRATGVNQFNTYSSFIPEWYPNARDAASAAEVTFQADRYVDDLFFFVRPSPSVITGAIGYAGVPTGTVKAVLFDNPNFLQNDSEPAYEINLGVPSSFPVSFEFTPVQPGTYYAAAFMDANGNGEFDRYVDALGFYSGYSNPPSPMEIYASLGYKSSDHDIALQNPEAVPAGSASLSGKVSYSGSATGKIWVALFQSIDLSGTPAYQTAADNFGSYSIPGIEPGTYYAAAYMESEQISGPRGAYAGPISLATSESRNDIDIVLADQDAGSVSGTVYYSGAYSSPIKIVLFNNSGFSGEPLAGTTLNSPSPYNLSGISSGIGYYIGAFMDLNANGQRDEGEPFGTFAGNPFQLGPSENKTGVSITLQDPPPPLEGNLGGLVFGFPQEGGEDVPISGATVNVLGTTFIAETRPIGDFAFDLPPDSSFVVRASKTGYLDSYTTIGRISEGYDGKNEIELLMLTPSEMSTWTGVPIESGKGHLVVTVHDMNPTSLGTDLVFGASAVVRDDNGQPAGGVIRYFTDEGTSMLLSPDATSGTGTIGFVVCNLQPGLYQITAEASAGVFAWRPVIVYADSLTIGFGSESGIRKVEGVIDVPIFVEDEEENPIGGAGVRLIGPTASTTTDSVGRGSIAGMPLFSTGPVKTSKDGYMPAYAFEIFGSVSDYDFSLISQEMMSALAAQAGVTLDPAKGHIAGEVDFFGEVPGATVTVLNADGTPDLNARIFYMNAEGAGIDPNLSSTSSDCTFFIFNLDPSVPVFLRADKENVSLPLILTKVWAGSLTFADMEFGGDIEVHAYSQHWSDGGYHAGLGVHDPNQLLHSVTVSGPGMIDPVPLQYGTGPSWWIQSPPSLGSVPPADPYTFTLTTKSGQVYTIQRNITGYVAEFATNLMPKGLTTTPVTFRWTGISDPSARYSIEVYDGEQGYRIWNKYDITGLEYLYDGQALILGKNYRYNIVAMVETDGVSNSSFASESFMITDRMQMPGDIDGDQAIDLKDAVLALKISAGVSVAANVGADVNKDARIGVSEAAYILAVLSGLRVSDTILQPPLVEGTASLISRNWGDNDGFQFKPPTVSSQGGSIDFYVETNIIFLAEGVGAQYLGLGSLENFQELPETNYIYSPNEWDLGILEVGQVFAFKLADGTYALVEFTEVAAPEGPEGSNITRCSFKYRYNPDGSRFFSSNPS